MKNLISENLKRLRTAKNLTQEQVAELLGVSVQSVSRWECGTNMPDIFLLPEISRIFGVTVDDLYREKSVAYENVAHRLASIYESTKQLDDFVRADTEFRKIMKKNHYYMNDLRMYGIIHQYMMNDCMQKAESLFNQVIKKGSLENEDVYWKTRRQKILLFSQTGRNDENIRSQLSIIQSGKGNAREFELLISAYCLANQIEEAYQWFEKAVKIYPDDCPLLLCGGDICKKLKMFDKAFELWDRALEINHCFYDAKYAKGFCYEELGEFKKAYHVWCEIIEDLDADGYLMEKTFPQELAKKCKEKYR